MTAREAASVILVRDAPVGFEVLLLQRHPNSRFSPGAYAFPGGRVEASDAAPAVEVRCRGLDRAEAARQLPDVKPPERAIGFWVAALREAFEEAGILLAYGPDARPVELTTLDDARAHRARCREDSARFGQLLTDLDLTLATDRVAYWAHWITPEERPIRYDTRFFVATARRRPGPGAGRARDGGGPAGPGRVRRWPGTALTSSCYRFRPSGSWGRSPSIET